MKHVYLTDDYKSFSTKPEAQRHENNIYILGIISQALEKGLKFDNKRNIHNFLNLYEKEIALYYKTTTKIRSKRGSNSVKDLA